MVTEWSPGVEEDRERLLHMVGLAAAALKSRDGDAKAANNAEQARVPYSVLTAGKSP